MGKRDRERVERIKFGNLFERIRNTGIKLATYGQVKGELLKGDTSDQVNKVNELIGGGLLPESKLKKIIMAEAPKEMDKAIKKYQKEGKEITVDTLTAEVESNKDGFRDLAGRAGLDLDYFRGLAKRRMEAKGIK